jgi:hypothetical protein
MMFGAHLSPSCKLYTYLLPPATTWSSEPTVDRTLGAITLKTKITISMALSQFFAAGLRLSLWKRGQLDTLQQEMMVKNILYLGKKFLGIFVNTDMSPRLITDITFIYRSDRNSGLEVLCNIRTLLELKSSNRQAHCNT